VHFAGYYAVLYGMNDANAYMADTRQQGGLLKLMVWRRGLLDL
jgi:hypothetical protein